MYSTTILAVVVVVLVRGRSTRSRLISISMSENVWEPPSSDCKRIENHPCMSQSQHDILVPNSSILGLFLCADFVDVTDEKQNVGPVCSDHHPSHCHSAPGPDFSSIAGFGFGFRRCCCSSEPQRATRPTTEHAAVTLILLTQSG